MPSVPCYTQKKPYLVALAHNPDNREGRTTVVPCAGSERIRPCSSFLKRNTFQKKPGLAFIP
eukprot:12051253-Prorocentrum_lima.AAC.1